MGSQVNCSEVDLKHHLFLYDLPVLSGDRSTLGFLRMLPH